MEWNKLSIAKPVELCYCAIGRSVIIPLKIVAFPFLGFPVSLWAKLSGVAVVYLSLLKPPG